MDLNEYQKEAVRTKGPNLDLLYFALAVAGEAGEFADLVKKIIYHKRNQADDYEKLIEELGDVLWGVAAAAEHLGITLDELARRNVDKLALRYPTGFEFGGGIR